MEDCNGDLINGSPSRSFDTPSIMSSPTRVEENPRPKEEKWGDQRTLAGRIANIFNRNSDSSSGATTSSRDVDFSEVPENEKPENIENRSEDHSSSINFEEAMKTMMSRDQESDIPSNLPGGVVLEQIYMIAPAQLNSLLFSTDSNFLKSQADQQGNTDLKIEPWTFENGGGSLKRVVSYTKAPTKLIKAVKATEEQTYLRADGKVFAVFTSVSTPDVPYGSTFKVELLHCITPGPELASGDQSSKLVISWRVNFLQSTIMKSMIENGARQGLRDNFEQFASLLSQDVNPLDLNEVGTEKEQVLGSLQAQHQSDWRLAVQYFANFTVVSTIFMGLYVLFHIWLAMPSTIQGLEFSGLDLPDSIGELIVSGVLVLQGERLLELISRFLQARLQRGKP